MNCLCRNRWAFKRTGNGRQDGVPVTRPLHRSTWKQWIWSSICIKGDNPIPRCHGNSLLKSPSFSNPSVRSWWRGHHPCACLRRKPCRAIGRLVVDNDHLNNRGGTGEGVQEWCDSPFLISCRDHDTDSMTRDIHGSRAETTPALRGSKESNQRRSSNDQDEQFGKDPPRRPRTDHGGNLACLHASSRRR